MASDVAGTTLSAATTASFATSSYVGCSRSGSVAGDDLLTTVAGLGWGMSNRNLIITPTLQSYILNNENVIQNYAFGGLVAQTRIIPNYYSFKPFVAQTISNNVIGMATIPGGLCFANSYHAPQEWTCFNASRLTDEKTGLTLGYRMLMDLFHASIVHIVDCLFGYGIGNPNAAILIKAA